MALKANQTRSGQPPSRYKLEELYRVEDDMGAIVVTQSGNRRIMSFGSKLEQSSIIINKPYYLEHEYTQVMLLGLLFVEAEHITVLGLGGGGLVHCLSHFYSQKKIQVVELRQSVIDVANDWFNLPSTPKLDIVCADAYQFLCTSSGETTDIIMSDLYEASGMSELQGQQRFIESAFKRLSENGCLVINFHERPSSESPLRHYLHELFSGVIVCDVFKGNQVIFCCKQTIIFDKKNLLPRVRELIKTVDMPLMYYFKQLASL